MPDVYCGKSVCVVVPAFNEERLIGPTLAGLPDYVDSIIVIDDASADETAARVEEQSKQDPRVVLLKQTANQGKGAAVVRGWEGAIAGGHDIVVLMDGDQQMPVQHMPSLLKAVAENGYDAAKGNRFLASPGTLASMPRHRLLGNIILTLMTKAASGYWSIFDSQNGYWAISAGAISRLDLTKLARRYDFENSLLIQFNIANARIADVPTPSTYGAEVSGIRLWRLVPRLFLTLFAGFWRRILLKYVLYNFHPVALFLFSGIALLLFGLVAGIVVVVQSLGDASATAGTVMLAVLPFLMGFQLLLAAMVLDILSEPK